MTRDNLSDLVKHKIVLIFVEVNSVHAYIHLKLRKKVIITELF